MYPYTQEHASTSPAHMTQRSFVDLICSRTSHSGLGVKSDLSTEYQHSLRECLHVTRQPCEWNECHRTIQLLLKHQAGRAVAAPLQLLKPPTIPQQTTCTCHYLVYGFLTDVCFSCSQQLVELNVCDKRVWRDENIIAVTDICFCKSLWVIHGDATLQWQTKSVPAMVFEST